jgi:hypothetical protein
LPKLRALRISNFGKVSAPAGPGLATASSQKAAHP